MKKKSNEVLIGFWQEPSNPDLPMPKADTARRDQPAVISLLKDALTAYTLQRYRGWSTCRICNCHNGSAELQIRRDGVLYRIPEGYLHYLTEHNVGYDTKLLKALGV